MDKSARNTQRAVLAAARVSLANIDERVQHRITEAARLIAGRKGKVVVSGVGKSSFVAGKMAATLTSLGIPGVFLHPTDALHGDMGIIREEDTVVVFSHSGLTRELVAFLGHVAVPVIGVTGSAFSSIAQRAHCSISYQVSQEGSPHGLAPMASTTTALVVGDMIAAQAATLRGFVPRHFAALHPGGSLGLQLTPVSAIMYQGSRVPLVLSSDTLLKTLRVMSQKKLGVAGVMSSGGRLVGALTDGDVRRFAQQGKLFSEHSVASAMSSSPKTVSQSASLLDALRMMEEHKVTSLFVVQGARPIGIIHLHQIIERQLT